MCETCNNVVPFNPVESEMPVAPDSVVDDDRWPNYPKAFRFAVGLTLEEEGILSDHIKDPGGLTKYGISKKTYPHLDIANLTKEDAVEIYYRDFWQRPGFGRIENMVIASELFDTAVNGGIGTAAKVAQRAVNRMGMRIGVDGDFGPVTRNALNGLAERYAINLLGALNGEQYLFYVELLNRDPARFSAFFKGWMKRTLVKEAQWEALEKALAIAA